MFDQLHDIRYDEFNTDEPAPAPIETQSLPWVARYQRGLDEIKHEGLKSDLFTLGILIASVGIGIAVYLLLTARPS